MSPHTAIAPSGVLEEEDNAETVERSLKGEGVEREFSKDLVEHPMIYVWRNIIIFAYLHLAALYGVYLAFTSAKWQTDVWAISLYVMGGLGITAGVHRLWSHRAYKAKWPLRLILALFNTLAHQNHIYEWARDHRLHHKYSDTNADPHNAKRGFFFSHVGWLLVRKHPDVIAKGKTFDMSDLEQDPIVMFQKNYYLPLMISICFVLPAVIPVYFWGESWSNAWHVATVLRYVYTLNMTWLVNSAAHMFGNKPFDKYMLPNQNIMVTLGALGEGWHNFHHTFPWDYRSAELGNFKYNFSTWFLHCMKKIGWAYDFKTVSPEYIKKRVNLTGDGTYVPAPKPTSRKQKAN